jgi:hypothetical protein
MALILRPVRTSQRREEQRREEKRETGEGMTDPTIKKSAIKLLEERTRKEIAMVEISCFCFVSFGDIRHRRGMNLQELPTRVRGGGWVGVSRTESKGDLRRQR